MEVKSAVVSRDRVARVWRVLYPGICEYRGKTPHHIVSDEQLLENWLSPEGDELFVFGVDGEYAGFMSFKVQELDGELWGTIAILYVVPKYQHGDVLPQAADQLSDILRERGCDVMNYMTARKGFKRLAPRLGFKPRITEWMKEL